jgi:hypothetical protein
VRTKAWLVQACAEKEKRTQELAAFRRWRLEEEQRLLAALTAQRGSVQDLLCFRSRIGGLRADQADRARRVDEATQQVIDAQKAHRTAQRDHAAAYRQRAKIQAHRERWQAELRVETERAMENEMEDRGGAVFANGEIPW